MNFKMSLIAGALVFALGLSGPLAYAQEEEELTAEEIEEIEEQEAFIARQRRTDDIDVGFEIPTEDEVQTARDRRRNQAASDRVGRAIMSAFELYEEEDLDGAIEELRGLSPRSAYDRAYVNRFLGNLYAANDQSDRAIEVLESAIEPDILGFGDQSAATLLLANLHLQEENHDQALRYYQKWLQFTGEMDADVFVRMANAHLQQENYEQVIPFARKALHYMETPHRNPYVLQVAAFFEMGETRNAIGVLEEGVQIMPGERRWWSQLGMLYFQEEEGDKALATMELAYLAGFLEQANDYRALAQMYSNKLIPYRAAEVMRTHLEAGDIDSTSRNYSIAASSYHSSREFARANEMYVLAAENADDPADQYDYHRRRGNSLLLGNEYAEAARAFNAALEAAPSGTDNLGRIYMSLAEAYFYNERYADAVQAAETAAGFSEQRRNAESWAQYIRTTAERRGVDI